MIARMSKYDFILYAGQSDDFIERLRELGLVDVTCRGWEPSEGDRQLVTAIEGRTKALAALERFRSSEHFDAAARPFASGDEAYERYGRLLGRDVAAARTARRRAALLHRAAGCVREIARRLERTGSRGGDPRDLFDGLVRRRIARRRRTVVRRAGGEGPRDDGARRRGEGRLAAKPSERHRRRDVARRGVRRTHRARLQPSARRVAAGEGDGHDVAGRNA